MAESRSVAWPSDCDVPDRNEGEYAVIDGQSLIGFFGDMEKAFAAGFKVTKRTDFFMGRVTPAPESIFIPTLFVCP